MFAQSTSTTIIFFIIIVVSILRSVCQHRRSKGRTGDHCMPSAKSVSMDITCHVNAPMQLGQSISFPFPSMNLRRTGQSGADTWINAMI
ncbi:uncharacterized protein B0T23DRAFT_371316 [Neurospora hispaniola]|uniref:Uncharacterized protein n=1 Tax=Neurospora hispaniola TaxID=588809 RepID=A0AAJ0IH09_9PEZI|nr:hypothetical protein B0T23DRAFT_371316 [Neurospora hispaniola]